MRIKPIRIGSLITLHNAQVGDVVKFRPTECDRKVLGVIEQIPRHRRFVVLAYEIHGVRFRESISTPPICRIVQKDVSPGWHISETGRENQRRAQRQRREQERMARHG